MRLNVRHLNVQKALASVDPLVDEELSDPEGSAASLYKTAWGMNKSPHKRAYIEACLLATDNLNEISRVIEIPIDVLDAYRKFFYDVEGFDKLSRLELVDIDSDTSNLKVWALSQGLGFIAWRLGKAVQISPVEGLKDLFSTCVYKSKECLFNSNATLASKESVKWSKLSIEIARLLKTWVMDSAAAKKDLELAIQQVVPEFQSIADLPGFDADSYFAQQAATAALSEQTTKKESD